MGKKLLLLLYTPLKRSSCRGLLSWSYYQLVGDVCAVVRMRPGHDPALAWFKSKLQKSYLAWRSAWKHPHKWRVYYLKESRRSLLREWLSRHLPAFLLGGSCQKSTGPRWRVGLGRLSICQNMLVCNEIFYVSTLGNRLLFSFNPSLRLSMATGYQNLTDIPTTVLFPVQDKIGNSLAFSLSAAPFSPGEHPKVSFPGRQLLSGWQKYMGLLFLLWIPQAPQPHMQELASLQFRLILHTFTLLWKTIGF